MATKATSGGQLVLHRPMRRGIDQERAARYKGGARCEYRVRKTSIHGAEEIEVASRKQHQSHIWRAASAAQADEKRHLPVVAVEQPRLRSVQKRLWGFRSPHS